MALRGVRDSVDQRGSGSLQTAKRESADGLAGVGFLKEDQYLLDGLGLTQEPAELILGEVSEDRFHRVDVLFGFLFRTQ